MNFFMLTTTTGVDLSYKISWPQAFPFFNALCVVVSLFNFLEGWKAWLHCEVWECGVKWLWRSGCGWSCWNPGFRGSVLVVVERLVAGSLHHVCLWLVLVVGGDGRVIWYQVFWSRKYRYRIDVKVSPNRTSLSLTHGHLISYYYH